MKNTRTLHTALVTGASGFIAGWLVKKLLEQGIEVHGTVRSLDDQSKTGHLHDIAAQQPGKLQLFEADLLEEGAFDAAAAGCDTIFHMASPFVPFNVKNPQQELVDPAVYGTRNVLNTANRISSVERVVLTSSVAAVMGDPNDKSGRKTQNAEADRGAQNRPLYTEEDWNHSSSLQHQPYNYSKVSAEREAWKIAEQQDRWRLVVINPSFVLGPTLSQRSDSTSTNMVLQFLNGSFKTGVPDLSFGIVDVREVAEAHIRAATRPAAEGRHIVSGPVKSMPEINAALRKHYPGRFKLPAGTLPKPMLYLFGPLQGFTWRYIRSNIGHGFELDNSKSREILGMEYRPVQETLKDQVDRLLEAGLVDG